MKVLLYGRNRHDPFVSVLQMNARLFRIHRLRFQQDYACNNLEAISDTVLNFLKQYVLLFAVGRPFRAPRRAAG